MSKISVVIIDDYCMARNGLKLWLEDEPDIEVVAEGVLGRDVLPLLTYYKPDVLLLSLHLPDRSGHEVINEIRSTGISLPILAMTGSTNESAHKALKAGANGLLTKTETKKHFIDAIRWAVSHELGIWSSSSEINKHRQIDTLVANAGLTKTDLSILALLELTNSEIAAQLYLSVGTVKNYVTRIYSKLGVNCRIAAYNWALENGIA